MRFEVGKYYRHVGRPDYELHVLGAVTGSIYHMGPVILVTEGLGEGTPGFVGSSEAAAENWAECAPWVIDKKKAAVSSAVEPALDMKAIELAMFPGRIVALANEPLPGHMGIYAHQTDQLKRIRALARKASEE